MARIPAGPTATPISGGPLKLPKLEVVVILAVLVTVTVLGVAFAPLGSTYKPLTPRPFDFSQNLTTGTSTAYGTPDCGPIATENVTILKGGSLQVFLTMNDSGSTGWVSMHLANGPTQSLFEATNGTIVHYLVDYGESVAVEFLLQGCGSPPTVALGFWGTVWSVTS